VNLSGIFVHRPVATTLLMAGLLLFGVMGYLGLPVSDLPNVDFPTISVSASLPGASPETMAAAVATPLEKEFSTIAGLESMTSSSSQGSTSITLQFVLDRDIDAAAQDVQAAIGKTIRDLPRDIVTPSYRKVNPADQPILFLALTTPTLPLSTLNEYAESLIAQRISTLPGVAQVQVYGSQKYALRIYLDPLKLSSRGIGIDEVAEAIRTGNVNLPTGTLWGPSRAFTLDVSGDLPDAESFRSLVVAHRGGRPVRLGDVGEVRDGVQNDKVAAWYRDNRAVLLAVQRQPGSNTVAVADSVKRLMEGMRDQIPAAVEVQVLYDRSLPIQESIHDVKLTLVLTFVLVILVIFLFLRNLRATIIPGVALPLSVAGAFALMKPLGYSLDNISLMALTLSLGFVVDDAIVMLENIVRHLEAGHPPRQAALEGSREIGFTILSMTVSLVTVFIPLFFMKGIVGRLFHEFAVVISLAILFSGVVSLTLTPMLCSKFLRPAAEVRHGRFFAVTERMWEAFLSFYVRSLDWFVRRRWLTLVLSALILWGTVSLFRTVPKGFLPSEDYGMISGSTEAQEGISFQAMVEHQRAAADILLREPDVEGFMSSVGGGTGVSNQGRFFLRLTPKPPRRRSVDQVMESLRPKLAAIPGMRIFLQNPPPIRIGGIITRSLYQYAIQGPDLEALYQAAGRLEARFREMPELQDVSSDLLLRNPQVKVDIDRERASGLGITAEKVENALALAYGARQVSTIFTPSNQYQVILQVLPEFQEDPSSLSLLSLRSSRGNLVPLGAVARMSPTVGPLTVQHSGQAPAVNLSFNLRPGVALGQGVAAVEAAAREILPGGVTGAFGGTAQAFQASQAGMLQLLLLSVLVIYLVLGILYESFIHPLTILTGLPFAGFGALLTLLVFKMELGVYGFVGMVMLIGVVKKNAIMMIDFALEGERREGKSPREAILEACRVRFRPIMMTTMAALAGTLPIALGLGAGAVSRRPLGLVVLGGLVFSQFITLYITPVFYTLFDDLHRLVTRRR
jgi:HAE1 family hydrophobic/amphiphilic exporter-1